MSIAEGHPTVLRSMMKKVGGSFCLLFLNGALVATVLLPDGPAITKLAAATAMTLTEFGVVYWRVRTFQGDGGGGGKPTVEGFNRKWDETGPQGRLRRRKP